MVLSYFNTKSNRNVNTDMTLVCKVLFLIIFGIIVSCEILNYYDLCTNNSGHKIYLEFQEIQTLIASNLSANLIKNVSVKQVCYLEIVTCPFCVIHMNFSFLNLSNNCSEGNNSNDCTCESLQISEHPYKELSLQKICKNDNFTLKTLTKNVIILLIYQFDNNLAFTAKYQSIRNRIYLTDKNRMENEFLLSPYFPSYYLNDLKIEYVISCTEEDDGCRVRLIFTDFQLAALSIMEIFDGNGQRLDVATGFDFRPPILTSITSSLIVKFYANGGTGLGYKAEYSFVSLQNEENNTKYFTDCGGNVDNLGGAITMMNMVKIGTKQYYCYWIIKPPKNYLHFKTYLYLKLANFSNMEKKTELIIHESTTSFGKVLEVQRHPNTDIYSISPREHIQSIDIGFYVSLKGTFGLRSRLAIVYATFSYKDCFSAADFLCENHRCIPRQLTCDGFDHCGDGSDETTSCLHDVNPEPIDRGWYSRTPNYFFPKIEPYSDLKTATLIFIMSSLGLISLVSAIFVLLYRINNRARHERELQNHLQIITDLLEEEVIETESIPDEPPTYEAPPDYDEIIKEDCDLNQNSGCKPKKPKRKKKGSKSIKSQKVNKTEESCSEATESNFNVFSSEIEEVKKERFRKNIPHFYFSDKAISTNVKLILKRKWHSQGELNIKKDTETIKKDKNILKLKQNKLLKRETASDSELLNIDTNYGACMTEKGLLDYFKRKNVCQCEGACSCVVLQRISKKYPKKFNKVTKNKYTKFYTK